MIYVGIDVAKDKHDCCILFPEREPLVPTLHMASVYALLSEFSIIFW